MICIIWFNFVQSFKCSYFPFPWSKKRHHDWSGVRQSVVLEGGQWYAAKVYIRLLNMPPGVSYITVELMAHLTVNGLKWTKIDIFAVSLKFAKLNFKEKENTKKHHTVFMCRSPEICNSRSNTYATGKVWLDWGRGRFSYTWW